MINSTFGGYMTAKLGLSAAQQGLYLTGQNLTNAGTEGYTRQRLDQVSINYGATYRYASKYNTNIGNGVLVKGTTQLRDPFLDLRYRNEVAHSEEQAIKLDALNDLRDILDEVKNAGDDSLGDGGIFNRLGDIIEKFKSYSSEIGSKEFDTMIKSSCQSLVTLFNAYSKRIDEVSENLNYDLETEYVPELNKILTSIQDLNKSIKTSEIIGQSALELKDERNLLIDQLSEYMKINVTYKPVNVSDTTVVDELHISMVGQDGKNYEIVADEQCRQFTLTKDGDKSIIGMTALTPVDQELKAELNTALVNLQMAQDRYDTRNQTFAEQYKNFDAVKTERDRRDQALADLQAQEPGLLETMNTRSDEYKQALLEYDALPKDQQTQEALQKVLDAAEAREKAVNAYNNLRSDIRRAEGAVEGYKSVYGKAEKSYKDALADLDLNPDMTDPDLQDANGDPLKNILTTPPSELHGEGLAEKQLEEAKERVTKALDALKQSEENGKAIENVNEVFTDGKLKGALEMLNYSAEFDDPPNSIRGIGYYKSMLDTLANKFAEAMNEANNPYEFTVNKVDENGNPLYTNYDRNEDGAYIFNGLVRLDSNGQPVKDADGNILDVDGNPIYQTDAKGNPIYDKDKNGQTIYINVLNADGSQAYEKNPDGSNKMQDVRDENGNLVYKTDDDGNIIMKPMVDENGNPIMDPVYENAKDKYGNPVLDVDGKPVRVLAYEMENPAYTEAKETDSKTPNISNMKAGNTITIDGTVYTYNPDAATLGANEFKDFNTLEAAAKQNGVVLAQGDDGTITGKTTVGKDISSSISTEKTIYTPNYKYEKEDDGVTNKVDKDGNPIRIVKREQAMEPEREQEPIPVRIPAPKKIAQTETQINNGTERHDLFKSSDGGKIVAGNIDLADGWVDNSYGITTALNKDDPSGNNTNVLHFINMLNGKLNYKADVNLMDGIEIDFGTNGPSSKEPSISGMKQGDTITIDGKVYTFTPGATGQAGNEFKDFDSLKIAAEKNGIALAQDANGKITASTIQKDLKYDVKLNGAIVNSLANIDVSALSYGDTITIDGETFTFKPAKYPDAADGTPGKDYADPTKGEFSSLDSLKKAAEDKNIQISSRVSAITMKDPDTGKTVNAELSIPGVTTPGATDEYTKLDPAALTDGTQVTIGGKTFTYVQPGADGSNNSDPDQNEFTTMDDLVALAGKNGFTIRQTITGTEKMAGQDVSDSISVDKEPGIGNMVTGNTITMGDDKTFTYVDINNMKHGDTIEIDGKTYKLVVPDPDATPPVDEPDPNATPPEFKDIAGLRDLTGNQNLFSDADSLKDAAAKEGYTIYVDPKTQQITTATKPGSNIFDGTFEEYYVSLDATLGMDIQATSEKLNNYSTLAGSIYDERESVTGVSHDEEAMNLMRYQQSYQAAARLMTTLDQVLDILLTQTGMVGR